MVGRVGFEPTTNWLKANCSTTELRALHSSEAPLDVGGVPNGIRTRVLALKGPRPGPLDDGDGRRVRTRGPSEHPEHWMITAAQAFAKRTARRVSGLSAYPTPATASAWLSAPPRGPG